MLAARSDLSKVMQEITRSTRTQRSINSLSREEKKTKMRKRIEMVAKSGAGDIARICRYHHYSDGLRDEREIETPAIVHNGPYLKSAFDFRVDLRKYTR